MASSSGAKNARIVDLPNYENGAIDSELVPSSIASIAPILRVASEILRVANEIEKDNPRVAYLCRFHAFEKAHLTDPLSSGRGVRQFKTYLLHRLEKEEDETKRVFAKNNPKEIILFYQQFYETKIRDGEYTKKPEEMAKIYQIATVLYDVLKTVVPPKQIDPQTQRRGASMYIITFFHCMLLESNRRLWNSLRSKQRFMLYAVWIIFLGPEFSIGMWDLRTT